MSELIQPKVLKGFRDFLPHDEIRRALLIETVTTVFRNAGFVPIDTPALEYSEVLLRKSNGETEKQVFRFNDNGGRDVALRFDLTVPFARFIAEHHSELYFPFKRYHIAKVWRGEKPQAGRYRQLQQMGVESIGVDDPALDAEVVALADRCYKSVGLTGYRLEITSLGDSTCRPAYRQKLQEFLFALPLDEETRRRAEINPLRVLDDKRPEVQDMTADAPLMLDHLSPETQEHFETVTGLLDDMGVAYVINPRMVRGLDYYTKTCFEFVHDGLGAQSGIGGGGRYDGLMAQLGGQELSGIGFGLGIDRTLLALQAEQAETGDTRRVDVFGVPMGSAAKRAMAVLINQLRSNGVSSDMSYGDRGLKGAMKGADRAHARFALILGDRELENGTIAVKDLAAQTQTDMDLAAVVPYLVDELG